MRVHGAWAETFSAHLPPFAERTTAARADHEATRSSSILTPEERGRVFDFEGRRVTGLSGEEFLRRHDAGEIMYLISRAAAPPGSKRARPSLT